MLRLHKPCSDASSDRSLPWHVVVDTWPAWKQWFCQTLRSMSTHRCSILPSGFLPKAPRLCAVRTARSPPQASLAVLDDSIGRNKHNELVCWFVRVRTLNHLMCLVSFVLAVGRHCQQCTKTRTCLSGFSACFPPMSISSGLGVIFCSREHDGAGSCANTCVRVESAGVSHEVTQDVNVPGVFCCTRGSAADPATSQLTFFARPFAVIVVQHAYFRVSSSPDCWNSTFCAADDELAGSGLGFVATGLPCASGFVCTLLDRQSSAVMRCSG